MNHPVIPITAVDSTKQRKRAAPKGRRVDPEALAEVQALLGEVFGLSQSRANRWIQRLLLILKQALDELGVLPSRAPADPGVVAAQDFGDWLRRRIARPEEVEQATHGKAA